MQEMFLESLKMFCIYFIELSALFILIDMAVGFINAKFSASLNKHLGQNKPSSYLKALALGALTPFCSCSTIPLFIALLRSKVSLGVSVAYLLISPLLNPIIITLFIISFGLSLSLYYSLFVSVAVLVLSYCVNKLDSSKWLKSEFVDSLTPQPTKFATSFSVAQPSSCCSQGLDSKTSKNSLCHSELLQESEESQSNVNQKIAFKMFRSAQHDNCQTKPMSNCHFRRSEESTIFHLAAQHDTIISQCCNNTKDDSTPPQNLKIQLKALLRSSLGNYKKILPYIIIGMGIGAFIHGFVPQGFLQESLLSYAPLAVIVAAFIAILLYVRVEAIIPIALGLMNAGVPLGVAMSFVIAGGGCSLPELILLKSIFKFRFLALFVLAVLGSAISFGLLLLFIA